jgi:hypothetical protein
MYARLPNPTSIRLLKLSPGQPNSQIVSYLEVADLELCPVFECLSYTWGTSANTSDINVNDSTIAIRTNLHTFLHKLRKTNKTRTFWVDALCISQADLDEKAHQVAMIGRIFRQASRVLVWVGEAANSSGVLFRPAANRLQAFWQDLTSERQSSAMLRRRVPIWNAFLSRPYWKRTWIIQEIILARTIVVHCGADHANWDSLIRPNWPDLSFDKISLHSSKLTKAVGSDAAKLFRSNVQTLEALAHSRLSYWRDHGSALPGTNIVFLATAFSSNECFDRRDKIYAMLSLETDEDFRNSIGVDYGISVEELFARVLVALEQHWNEWLAVTKLVKIFDMSQREASELLEYLRAYPQILSTGSISTIERYAYEGSLNPVPGAASRIMVACHQPEPNVGL